MFPTNMASGRPKPPKNSIIMDTDTIVYTDPMSVTPDNTEPPIKTLMGTIVGLLDDSQKDRVLSAPDSVLSFATFHPLAASGRTDEDRKLSARTQLEHAKRIVIETFVSGETFWRYVPRARGVNSVGDEGTFPRVVLVCGQQILMGQEQWDIYKLDSFYDCYIPSDGTQSTITPNKGKEKGPSGPSDASSQASSSSTFTKRSFSASDADSPVHRAAKQRRAYVESDDEDEDEVADIVESMVAGPSVQERKSDMYKARAARREKLASTQKSRHHTLTAELEAELIDLTMDDIDDVPPAAPATSYKHVMNEEDYHIPRRAKVPRLSPGPRVPLMKPPGQRRNGLTKAWQKYLGRQDDARKYRDQELNQAIAEDAQAYPFSGQPFDRDPPTNGFFHSRGPPAPEYNDSDPGDPVPLEEKIRRMREINQKEAAAVERRKAQEAAQRAHAEAERVKAEAERARAEAEQHMTGEQRRQRDEDETRTRWANAKQRIRTAHPSWSLGRWTTDRALECYRMLSSDFDKGKFTAEDPVTFYDVPWPVLHPFGTYGPEDVDWLAVERFFEEVKYAMRAQDFKSFLQDGQRRFHPDRWASRRRWDGIAEKQKNEMQTAVEIVSKSIGCILDKANNSAPPPPTSFSHPTIEYHYADDSPHHLLPRAPGEIVLVLDHDSTEPHGFSAKSLTTELAVVGLKVTEAPGAGVVDDGVKNNNMYVLETTVLPEETVEEEDYQSPQLILARFKQRNALLRRVLDYPQHMENVTEDHLPSEPLSNEPPSAGKL
ncbi:hypothetical protein BXZ70DRAFT_1003347 [Cristinia sonorae]|uniref:Uncharacterized protein n=1 Tax=Cristinia sonorae TaxID=1940300 RepID=A0A8K0V036_9AGAR|nr:hypothetical protein BXZ70DRAFT_1003347 [Cristinia sonorae]